jgi:hypothetical protein
VLRFPLGAARLASAAATVPLLLILWVLLSGLALTPAAALADPHPDSTKYDIGRMPCSTDSVFTFTSASDDTLWFGCQFCHAEAKNQSADVVVQYIFDTGRTIINSDRPDLRFRQKYNNPSAGRAREVWVERTLTGGSAEVYGYYNEFAGSGRGGPIAIRIAGSGSGGTLDISGHNGCGGQ